MQLCLQLRLQLGGGESRDLARELAGAFLLLIQRHAITPGARGIISAAHVAEVVAAEQHGDEPRGVSAASCSRVLGLA